MGNSLQAAAMLTVTVCAQLATGIRYSTPTSAHLRAVVKQLSTVTTLQQERLSSGDISHLLAQSVDLLLAHSPHRTSCDDTSGGRCLSLPRTRSRCALSSYTTS